MRRGKHSAWYEKIGSIGPMLSDNCLIALPAIAKLMRASTMAEKAMRHASERLGAGDVELSHPDFAKPARTYRATGCLLL